MRTSQPIWAVAFLCLCLSLGSILMTPMASPSAATPRFSQVADIETPTDMPAQYTAQNVEAEIMPAVVSVDAASPDELFTRGRSLYEGRNFDDAFVMFERAAKAGHAQAQYMTGFMLSRGEGVPLANEDEAARYYTMSAQQGFAKAQAALGMMYYNGTQTMARDSAEAHKWFYLASLQGDQRAMKMLARVQKDMDEQAPATAQSGPRR